MCRAVRLLAAWVLLLLCVVGCSTGDPTATPVPLNVVALNPIEVVVLPTASPAPLNALALEATEVVDLPTATPDAAAETAELRITIIYDNFTYDPRLTADWGFAALVEYRGHTLLFDTGGNPDILVGNMEILEIDPMSIEAVVLSHSHGDHTDGWAGLVRAGAHPPVYVPPSFRNDFKQQLRRSSELVEVEPGQEILPGVLTTGELGTGQIPEQALVVQLEDGIVVVTGCAHPGIVEMVARAKELFEGPVRLVLGGFHLGEMSASDICSILTDFQRLGVEQVAPTHCTGERAIDMFAASYGDSCVDAGTGRVIVIGSEP